METKLAQEPGRQLSAGARGRDRGVEARTGGGVRLEEGGAGM